MSPQKQSLRSVGGQPKRRFKGCVTRNQPTKPAAPSPKKRRKTGSGGNSSVRASSRIQLRHSPNKMNTHPTTAHNTKSRKMMLWTCGRTAKFNKEHISHGIVNESDPKLSQAIKELHLDLPTIVAIMDPRQLVIQSYFQKLSFLWSNLSHHAGVSPDGMRDYKCWRASMSPTQKGCVNISYVRSRGYLLQNMVVNGNEKSIVTANFGCITKIFAKEITRMYRIHKGIFDKEELTMEKICEKNSNRDWKYFI